MKETGTLKVPKKPGRMKRDTLSAGKKLIKKLAPRLPYSIKRFSNLVAIENMRGATSSPTSIADMWWSLENLKRNGFSPKLVVDIGAFCGDWSKSASDIFTDAKFFMVEAQEGMKAHLEGLVREDPKKFLFSISLLGSKSKKSVEFYEMATGSSVYPEISGVQRTKRKALTRTLDGLLAAAHFGRPDFIKLDVQGYEIEVLKGAAGALKSCEALLLEVSLLPLNRGAPDFFEVISFLEKRGFSLYDVCSLTRRSSDAALIQMDLLMLKKGSRLTGP